MRLRWSIDQLYFYLVCFVTLIMIIVGGTQFVRAGIELIVPIPEETGEFMGRSKPYEPGQYGFKTNLPAELVEKELEEQSKFNEQLNKQNNYHHTIGQLLHGFSIILIAFPVYFFHWRKIPLLKSD